jgi:SAM-dependent methyltransferase
MSEGDLVWAGDMPAAYDRRLAEPVFRPFAIHLASLVTRATPRRVLELAAGTGVLTRELVTSTGAAEVVATDLNPAMVDYGRVKVPAATWRTADATHLPFDAGEFDLVVCQFGVMFFPDKVAAFADIRRLLSADGRFLFNAWATLDEHEFEAALTSALKVVFPDDPPAFLGSVPHGYAEPEIAVADVRAAGFGRAVVTPVTLEGRMPSATDIAVAYCTGTPLRAAIEQRGDLATATNALAAHLEVMLGPGPVTGRMTAYVVEAGGS